MAGLAQAWRLRPNLSDHCRLVGLPDLQAQVSADPLLEQVRWSIVVDDSGAQQAWQTIQVPAHVSTILNNRPAHPKIKDGALVNERDVAVLRLHGLISQYLLDRESLIDVALVLDNHFVRDEVRCEYALLQEVNVLVERDVARLLDSYQLPLGPVEAQMTPVRLRDLVDPERLLDARHGCVHVRAQIHYVHDYAPLIVTVGDHFDNHKILVHLISQCLTVPRLLIHCTFQLRKLLELPHQVHIQQRKDQEREHEGHVLDQ